MMGQAKHLSVLIIMVTIFSAAAVILLVYLVARPPAGPGADAVTAAKKLAGELADNNLPEAAVEEYRRLLDDASLSTSERGAIYYLIGKLYFEDGGDYEKAAAYYIRARAMDEKASYYAEAGRNLITCLERLGRRLDARRELDMQASAKPDSSAGKIVAIVGSENITLAEFNQMLEAMPPEVQAEMKSPEKRKELLGQLIGRELIYHAALREGMDRESAPQKDLKQLEKEYLVAYYSEKKIRPTIKPDSADLRLYYQAHKSTYEDKPFDEVRSKVTQDYLNYIGQKAVTEHVEALRKAEPIQTFEENLK